MSCSSAAPKKSSLCEASKGRGKAEAEQARSCHVSSAAPKKSSLCEASKGRGKAKRGRGRGKDTAAAPEHSVVCFRCPDFVDVDWVRQMGAMPGSLYIDTRFTDSRGEGPIRSLRTVCCQLVERASTDGSLDCWYKEDKLPHALGARGRTWSGISLEEMTEAETAELSALRCSSGYDATRSCFHLPQRGEGAPARRFRAGRKLPRLRPEDLLPASFCSAAP